MMMGYRLNIITQAPYIEDRANLPVGVYMVPTYSKLCDGRQSVAVVLCNLTGQTSTPPGQPSDRLGTRCQHNT